MFLNLVFRLFWNCWSSRSFFPTQTSFLLKHSSKSAFLLALVYEIFHQILVALSHLTPFVWYLSAQNAFSVAVDGRSKRMDRVLQLKDKYYSWCVCVFAQYTYFFFFFFYNWMMSHSVLLWPSIVCVCVGGCVCVLWCRTNTCHVCPPSVQSAELLFECPREVLSDLFLLLNAFYLYFYDLFSLIWKEKTMGVKP